MVTNTSWGNIRQKVFQANWLRFLWHQSTRECQLFLKTGPRPREITLSVAHTPLVLSALCFHYWLALKGKCDSWATVITAPLVCSLSFCVQIVFIFMSMSEPLCSTLGNTYLGGPQNTPPQRDLSSVVVLQHSCLLLHCQISGTDICKTQRSELHCEGIEASRAQTGSIRR